jgi:hypothetical protein
VRRVVLILATIAAILSVAPIAAAVEGPARGANFELHEGGFLVSVRADATEEKVTLTLYRHGEVAIYNTAADFTDDTVKARFGQLGELDYTFTPSTRVGQCSEFADGTFVGTLTFTGENEYVAFQADRAHGSFLSPPRPGCRKARRARPGAEPEREPEASLLVHSDTRPLRSMVVFEGEAKHRRHVFFSAFEYEEAEGMVIERGAQMVGPPRDFTWDLEAGTARVDPPVPFTGSATFKRRPGGKPRWSGSLRVPMLGGRPFRLVGGDFQAQLIKGSILD